MLLTHRVPTFTTPVRRRATFADPFVHSLARSAFGLHSSPQPSGPAVDGRWTDEGYTLTVDLPGVDDDAVAVSVAGRTLTIEVAVDEESWTQRLRLAQSLDAEAVSAHYRNGRLTVTIPRSAEPEARRIELDTSAPAVVETPAIDAADGDAQASDDGDADDTSNG